MAGTLSSMVSGLFNGSGTPRNNHQTSRRNTPTMYPQGQNANREQGGMVYPLYRINQGADLGGLEQNHTQGNESDTWQSQAGSYFQMRADGSIQIRACDSMYTLTFGTNRVFITGAHDVTVQGDGSLCVEGDYNCTVRKNANFTVQGDFNVTSNQFNVLAGGGFDIAAKSIAMRSESAIESTAEGNIHNNAKGSIAQVARGGSFSVRAGNEIQMAALSNAALTAQTGQLDFFAATTFNADGPAGMFLNSGKAKMATHRDLASLVPPAIPTVSNLAPATIQGIDSGTPGGGAQGGQLV